MDAALIVAGAIAMAASIPVIARVKAEYEGDGTLSDPTVAAVWGLYTAIVAVVVLAAVFGVWRIDLPDGLSVAAGVVLLLAGLGLETWGLVSMASFHRMSRMQPDRLIEGGAFRYSRNPQNVGLGLALSGIALLGDSGLALLLAAGFWAIFRAYVGYEEAHLARTFGAEYERYRRRTPRFLGGPFGLRASRPGP
jgi:protein-S-isoprenylcysteine O-methyltransferase Ste14